MKKKQSTKNNGVTLISLIITIIILIILASVSINVTIGENGIINMTKKAKEDIEIASKKEQEDLEKLYSQIGQEKLIGGTSITELQSKIEELTSKVEILEEKGTNPTGTIISYMGNNPPEGYISCDGQIYNISEYQNLAEQIKQEFGQYNYYGGDGNETFAVPDLRGEFLRGTGTNSHTNSVTGTNEGSGSNVGIHQSSTAIPHVYSWNDGSRFSVIAPVGNKNATMTAQYRDSGTVITQYFDVDSNRVGNQSGRIGWYTSRPTNTSVLYCIKY